MAGLGIKVFTDEMITPRLADELSKRGYDVLSCYAAGRARRRISDHDQLLFAKNEGRAIYTFNVRHFDRLDRAWHEVGVSHAGIIASEDLNPRFAEMVDRLQRHLDTVTRHVQHDRFLRLSR